MKKYILVILIIVLSFYLTGCNNKIYTETQGDLVITYLYGYNNSIVSKNIYDTSTGITTEYIYYYDNLNGTYQLKGTNIIVIAKDGKISGEFKDG